MALDPSGGVLASTSIQLDLPPLMDGRYQLKISVQGFNGKVATRSVAFETSTGGGTTTVTGRLLDPARGVGIEGAVVYPEESDGIQATTDARGNYVLSDSALATGEGIHLVFDDPRSIQLSERGGKYTYPLYKRPIRVLPGERVAAEPCYLPKARREAIR